MFFLRSFSIFLPTILKRDFWRVGELFECHIWCNGKILGKNLQINLIYSVCPSHDSVPFSGALRPRELFGWFENFSRVISGFPGKFYLRIMKWMIISDDIEFLSIIGISAPSEALLGGREILKVIFGFLQILYSRYVEILSKFKFASFSPLGP